ncbi:hypothetical protein TNCV_133501 [Trichonephila clavipes]|nr:hypothetical protein TNCV_133501 [Trichonephila clavipes]
MLTIPPYIQRPSIPGSVRQIMLFLHVLASQGLLTDPPPADPISHSGLPSVDYYLRSFSTSSTHNIDCRPQRLVSSIFEKVTFLVVEKMPQSNKPNFSSIRKIEPFDPELEELEQELEQLEQELEQLEQELEQLEQELEEEVEQELKEEKLSSDYEVEYFQILPGKENEPYEDSEDKIQDPYPQIEPLNESAFEDNSEKLPIEIQDLKQEKPQVDQCEDPGLLRESSLEDDSEEFHSEHQDVLCLNVKIDRDHYDVSEDLNTATKRIRG